MANAASTAGNYSILTRVHKNKYDPATQTTVPGWEFAVRDGVTQAVVPVFLDDAHFSPENMDAVIRATLDPIRATLDLGK